MTTEAKRSKAPHKPSPLEYGLYFGASFVAFLPVAALRQVMPAPRDAFGNRQKRRGVLGEVRAMAAGIVPFVFMH
jgi:hypothetical protein